jgi:hypothetical protein
MELDIQQIETEFWIQCEHNRDISGAVNSSEQND